MYSSRYIMERVLSLFMATVSVLNDIMIQTKFVTRTRGIVSLTFARPSALPVMELKYRCIDNKRNTHFQPHRLGGSKSTALSPSGRKLTFGVFYRHKICTRTVPSTVPTNSCTLANASTLQTRPAVIYPADPGKDFGPEVPVQ